MTAICANNIAEIRSCIREHVDFNFLHKYSPAGLDEMVTPLTVACYLGRLVMVKILIVEVEDLDINLPTSPICTLS